MKRCVLCLTLSLSILLSACGGQGEDSRSQASSLLGGAVGLEDDEILLTVDDREVPAWRYLYWLARTCDAIYEDYEAAGQKPDWTDSVGTASLGEYAKAQALSDTLLYATVENWAEGYGCEISEQESGEPAYGDPKLGLGAAQAAELDNVGRMYSKLYELFYAGESALVPSEEELAAFAEKNGWLSMDRILVAADDDRDAAREKAAEMFSRLNAAADQTAEFAGLAAAGDDAGGQRTFCLGDGTVDPILEKALQELEEGQCSGILESEEGFSILRKLEVPKETLMEPYFDQLLQSAAETAKVQCGEAYNELNAEAFYRELQKLRKAE